jgi:hypothetical protein
VTTLAVLMRNVDSHSFFFGNPGSTAEDALSKVYKILSERIRKKKRF